VKANVKKSCRLPVSVIAIFLVGCGMTDTIDSSGTSDSNRALILGASRGTALFSPRPVVIKSVDGRSVAATADSVRVSPGIHVLVVTCYQSLFARNTHELSVSVDAGETYILTSQISPDKISDGSAECEAEITRSEPRE
jgi:hypothetical protein